MYISRIHRDWRPVTFPHKGSWYGCHMKAHQHISARPLAPHQPNNPTSSTITREWFWHQLEQPETLHEPDSSLKWSLRHKRRSRPTPWPPLPCLNKGRNPSKHANCSQQKFIYLLLILSPIDNNLESSSASQSPDSFSAPSGTCLRLHLVTGNSRKSSEPVTFLKQTATGTRHKAISSTQPIHARTKPIAIIHCYHFCCLLWLTSRTLRLTALWFFYPVASTSQFRLPYSFRYKKERGLWYCSQTRFDLRWYHTDVASLTFLVANQSTQDTYSHIPKIFWFLLLAKGYIIIIASLGQNHRRTDSLDR